MCNAWNHPPACRCGWGGYGHLGHPVSPRERAFHLFPGVPTLKGLTSFTVPNASCPVCGAWVFFYQSAQGGRVFFDELGPPWPKHPCTDRTSVPKSIGKRDALALATRQAGSTWQKEGWSPFIVNSAHALDRRQMRLEGETADGAMTIFVGRVTTGNGDSYEWCADSIVLIRPSRIADCFDLSLLGPTGVAVAIKSYQSLHALNAARLPSVVVHTSPPRRVTAQETNERMRRQQQQASEQATNNSKKLKKGRNKMRPINPRIADLVKN